MYLCIIYVCMGNLRNSTPTTKCCSNFLTITQHPVHIIAGTNSSLTKFSPKIISEKTFSGIMTDALADSEKETAKWALARPRSENIQAGRKLRRR